MLKPAAFVSCLALGMAATLPPSASSQSTSGVQWPPVASLLQSFEQEVGRADGRGRVPAGITHMLAEPGTFSSARLDSLFAGLEELAIRSSTDHVGRTAVINLSSAADRNASQPQPGIVDRLERIHQSAVTRAARSAALDRLPFQADAPAALRAVERAAAADTRNQAYPGSAREAVALLRSFGPAGEGALRRLRQSSRVQDCDARAELARQLRDLP